MDIDVMKVIPTEELLNELACRHKVMFFCGWKGMEGKEEDSPVRLKGPPMFVEPLVVTALTAAMNCGDEEEEEDE